MKLIRNIFAVTLIALFAINTNFAQNKTSVVTKVTATWCPNCGSWGWDYFEALKDIYTNDTKATLLGVHHSGDLKNNVSSWFTDNLDFIYQPQFFHNREDLNVSRNNWDDKVDELIELVEEFTNESTPITVGFKSAYVMNDQITCVVNVDATNKSAGENYIAIYVFENNVENNQSGRGMALHPNVLRDVMNQNNYGDLLNNSDPVTQTEFTLPMNASWDKDNLGLLAIVWEEDGGSYNFSNASSIHNIGLLSSSNEVLDIDNVDVTYLNNGFRINTNDQEEYKLFFYSSNAQLLQEKIFSDQTTIDTSDLPAGLYSIHLIQDNKIYTQQVFVN